MASKDAKRKPRTSDQQDAERYNKGKIAEAEQMQVTQETRKKQRRKERGEGDNYKEVWLWAAWAGAHTRTIGCAELASCNHAACEGCRRLSVVLLIAAEA
jgi:hypothetical protein